MRFQIKQDANGQKYLETDKFGYDLIYDQLLNKSTAFTAEERDAFQLHGLIPPHQFELHDIVEKRYHTLLAKPTDLEKHIFLRQLQDRNEVLFYALIDKHIEEVMPLVYTPVVGQACQEFSNIYRKARGLFISYPHQDKIEMMLSSPYFDDVEVIVVSDGERILGLGDQGAGGMGIPIGKLSLYTACAGIAPQKTLPVLLDVGTDNEVLLTDPQYIGWHHHRVRGEEYDQFVAKFIAAVKKRFPHILLQWEDFAQPNAIKLLHTYQDELCSFNDDIQGTAAIAVGAIISGIKASGTPLNEQRIVVVGAGSAGVGISNLLVEYFCTQGISRIDAYARIFLVDRNGLLTEHVEHLDFQANFVKTDDKLQNWHFKSNKDITLLETVTNAKATVLIGVSGQAGIFTQHIIMQMALNASHPIIFPLSNPTIKAEATPHDILQWTNGHAIIGTGSPFPLVERDGHLMRVDQVNNCYIFPGVGLGILAVKANRVTNKMFLLAAMALSEMSPALKNSQANLLPPLEHIRDISQRIAFAVAKEAVISGLTDLNENLSDSEIRKLIAEYMWEPEYLPYRRIY
jgi:malate dehydrogenase (oxaloacetate-decarboxylating)